MKKPKPKKARPPAKKKTAAKSSLAAMEEAMRIFGPALSSLTKK